MQLSIGDFSRMTHLSVKTLRHYHDLGLLEPAEAKNEHDIDAMLAPFDEDTSVKDEGQEHHGRPAIRSWMEDVTRK